jgi:hypothetical protein
MFRSKELLPSSGYTLNPGNSIILQNVMLNTMDEQRKCKNVNKEEGKLRNELKRNTVKAKKESFESIFHEIKREYLIF